MWDKEERGYMESILNELYHHFYRPLELSELKQEVEECREKLAETLDKPERKVLLQLMDAQDAAVDELSADSFICGFKLGLQLSWEMRYFSGL